MIQKNHSKLAGVQNTVEKISKILTIHKDLRSGLIGVTDDLEIVYFKTFCDELKLSSIKENINTLLKQYATGIVVFNLPKNDILVMSDNLFNNLIELCAKMQVSLLDVVLYSQHGWVSLRQRNLL